MRWGNLRAVIQAFCQSITIKVLVLSYVQPGLSPKTVTNTNSDSASYSKFQNTQQNTYNRQWPLDIGQNSHTMVETARTTISTDQAGNDVEAFAVLIDHRSVLVWFQG